MVVIYLITSPVQPCKEQQRRSHSRGQWRQERCVGPPPWRSVWTPARSWTTSTSSVTASSTAQRTVSDPGTASAPLDVTYYIYVCLGVHDITVCQFIVSTMTNYVHWMNTNKCENSEVHADFNEIVWKYLKRWNRMRRKSNISEAANESRILLSKFQDILFRNVANWVISYLWLRVTEPASLSSKFPPQIVRKIWRLSLIWSECHIWWKTC